MIGRRQFLATGIGALSAARIVAFDRGQPALSPAARPNPLVVKTGVYANFTTAEGWAIQAPESAIESSPAGHGESALRLTSTNGVGARSQAFLGPPPSRLLQVDVYVPDPASCQQFEILFTSNGFTGWLWMVNKNVAFQHGWNRLQFSANDCMVIGSGMTLDDWDQVSEVRIYLISKPGATATVWLTNFRWLQTRAALTFTFDDGRSGCYTHAMPILKKYGWAATIYIVTDAVGQPSYTLAGSGDSIDPLNLDQLKTLQDAGWDISAHTCTHPDLTVIPSAQKQVELQASQEWLFQNGFSNGARFFATPYGRRDGEVTAIASSLYDNLRDTGASAGFETPLNMNGALSTRYGLRNQVLQSLSRTPLEQVQSWVDAAIASGTWLIIVGHSVDGLTGWLDPGLFQQYVDYVASRRDHIDVLSMSAYWDRRIQSLAQFSNTISHSDLK